MKSHAPFHDLDHGVPTHDRRASGIARHLDVRSLAEETVAEGRSAKKETVGLVGLHPIACSIPLDDFLRAVIASHLPTTQKKGAASADGMKIGVLNQEESSNPRALLASKTDYVYAVTLNRGRSVATSHGVGCEALTGYTSDEFDADPELWYGMIHADDRPAVLAKIDCILAGEVPQPLEHRIIHKNGTTRWIRNVPVPHRDDKGRLTSYSGLISDITNRKRAEQLVHVQYCVIRELAESGALANALRRILEAICEIFPWDWAAFWSYDEKANLLRWGGIRHSPCIDFDDFEASGRGLAFARGVSLPGRVWVSRKPEWIPDVAEDANFLRAGAAARADLHSACALPIWHGSQIAGVIELFSRKIQPPDPQVMEMLATVGVQIEQFIDRKQAEEALGDERNLLRTLIDHLPDYVYVKDTRCRFIMSNPAHLRILGVARLQDVLGRSDSDFFSENLSSGYRADDEAVLRSGQPIVNREESVMDRQGRTRCVLTTKVPLVNEQGAIVGLVGVTRDITEHQQAREELSRAYVELAESQKQLQGAFRELKASHEELKATELQLIQAAKMESIGSLAAGVAHEVKNPLQTVLMGLHYLSHNLPDDNEAIVMAMGDMREGVNRANKILRGLLDLAADTKFEMKTEDLNACVERSLYLLQHEFVATQITIARNLSNEVPLLHMDRGQMEQILLNLFINSLHAMPEGGTLTVSTSVTHWTADLPRKNGLFAQFKAGDILAVVEIQDTGSGISEIDLPRVFDPFFTTKSAGQGTGLGLAVVRKIVNLHSGAIDLQNSASGGVLVTLVFRADLENSHGEKTHSDC